MSSIIGRMVIGRKTPEYSANKNKNVLVRHCPTQTMLDWTRTFASRSQYCY